MAFIFNPYAKPRDYRLVIVCGFLALTAGLYTLVEGIRFFKRAVPVTGKVTRINPNPIIGARGDKHYLLIVHFELPTGASKDGGVIHEGALLSFPPVGSELKLLYDPENPWNVTDDKGLLGVLLLPAVCILLGGVLAGVGLRRHLVRKKKRLGWKKSGEG